MFDVVHSVKKYILDMVYYKMRMYLYMWRVGCVRWRLVQSELYEKHLLLNMVTIMYWIQVYMALQHVKSVGVYVHNLYDISHMRDLSVCLRIRLCSDDQPYKVRYNFLRICAFKAICFIG